MSKRGKPLYPGYGYTKKQKLEIVKTQPETKYGMDNQTLVQWTGTDQFRYWYPSNDASFSWVGMTTGPNVSQRIGNKVYIKSFLINGIIKQPTFGSTTLTDGQGSYNVTLFLVLDRAHPTEADPSNGLPDITQIFSKHDGGYCRNEAYIDRYDVLTQTTVNIRPKFAVYGTTYTYSQVVEHFSLYHRFKTPLLVNNIDVNAYNRDITPNNVYVVIHRDGYLNNASCHLYYGGIRKMKYYDY